VWQRALGHFGFDDGDRVGIATAPSMDEPSSWATSTLMAAGSAVAFVASRSLATAAPDRWSVAISIARGV
jgi:hypothetical protein